MPALYASIYGGATGLLVGFGIAMFHDMALPDAFFRLFVLVAVGATLGGLMAWLDGTLTPLETGCEAREQTESQR